MDDRQRLEQGGQEGECPDGVRMSGAKHDQSVEEPGHRGWRPQDDHITLAWDRNACRRQQFSRTWTNGVPLPIGAAGPMNLSRMGLPGGGNLVRRKRMSSAMRG
jgi:hypothetical protein